MIPSPTFVGLVALLAIIVTLIVIEAAHAAPTSKGSIGPGNHWRPVEPEDNPFTAPAAEQDEEEAA